MTPQQVHVRSLSCVELIGLLDEDRDAIFELQVFFADGGEPVRMHRSLCVDRRLALALLGEYCGRIEACANAACCVTDVPHLDAVLCLDGEQVCVVRFPEAAVRIVVPLYDGLFRALGRGKAPAATAWETPTRAGGTL